MSQSKNLTSICTADCYPVISLTIYLYPFSLITVLRLCLQKNPGAIRHPEEDKGVENIEMELQVDVGQAQMLSPYIPLLCDGAKDSSFTRDADLKLIARST